MTRTDDGGPVFPWADHGEKAIVTQNHPGMSLRDYFAAAALSSYAAVQHDASAADVVGWCYEYADAMLAFRAKEPTR